MEAKILEITIEYKGDPIKIIGGKVYCLGFGTTITDHSMHYNWIEIKKKNLTKNFKRFLEDCNLL
jgi:hypothetical protein